MADSKQEKDSSSSPVNGGEATAGGDRGRRAHEHGKKPRREIEIGGPKGPEPTRYGDWERKGIATDF